jgi:DNA topoisomerase IB
LTISRRICGRGFSYHRKSGRRIRDPRLIDRLVRLAVPPAYTAVAYSSDETAPLRRSVATLQAGGSIATIRMS